MEFKSPEESLLCYFDELLEEAPVVPQLASVRLAARQDENQLSQRERVMAEPSPAIALADSLKKQQLEKLFKAAQSQILVEAKPHVEDQKVVVETSTPPVVRAVTSLPPAPIENPIVASIKPIATPIHVEEKSIDVDPLAWLENGRPAWAQSRFDVLLFTVSGLQLAVPLIALGQIQPITDELTPLFGQADWFMGLQPTPQGKIRTVNTAKFVMPERYDERFVQTAKYVVSINGLPWGLAVDGVNQPITLNPDDVRWRTDRSKREWLAGTVKEHMCALLDIPKFGQLLQAADKNYAAKG